MKQTTSWILSTLLLAMYGCDSGTAPPPPVSPVEWLESHALKVRSVEPDDDDFQDLEPLRQVLGDRRVVMLGEQSHGDGTTFLAKTRLIKFLHQELGFDVLVFESGLYDCHKVQAFLEDGWPTLEALQQGVYSIWTGSQQVRPLVDYLSETASIGQPIEYAGCDSQFTGSASAQFFVDDLVTFL